MTPRIPRSAYGPTEAGKAKRARYYLKGKFTWKILWPETGEILIKPGYAYPHTALAGARAFVKDALTYGDRGDFEPLRVEVIEGSADDATEGKGTVMRTFEGTCRDFLKR